MPEIRYRYYAIGLDRSDLDTAEVVESLNMRHLKELPPRLRVQFAECFNAMAGMMFKQINEEKAHDESPDLPLE